MKIKRLRIDGFGRLRGDLRLDPDRCNLALAANESGKSTLVAALLAGLYGLAPDRRSKNNPIPSRDAHRPWDGGPYGVEVELEIAGDSFSIRRNFANDDVVVRNGRTGKDVTEEFRGVDGSVEVLERLIGLGRDDFARSALVMQDEIESIRDGSDITLRLQKFATSQGGDITAGEAVECLEDALRRYEGSQLASHGKVETELRRVQDRLGEVRRQQEALESDHAACAEDLELLRDLGEQEADLSARLHRLDYLRTRAIILEIDEQITTQNAAAAELLDLRAEEQGLASRAGFPLDFRAEMNELKGKADELADRLEAERAELQAEVEAPLAEVRDGLAPHESALALGPEDGARLETVAVRLRDLRDSLKGSRHRLRKERRRLRNEGLDLEEIETLRSRFGALPTEDRDFLSGYREHFLELEARYRERQENPPDDLPGGPGVRWSLVLPGLLLMGGGGAAWFLLPKAVAVAASALGAILLAVGLWRRRTADTPRQDLLDLESEKDELRRRAEELRERLSFLDVDETLVSLRKLDEIGRRTGTLDDDEEACVRAEDSLHAVQAEAVELLARAGRELTAERVRPQDIEELRDGVREGRRLQERATDLGERAGRGAAEIRSLEERLSGLQARMREILQAAAMEPEDAKRISNADLERFTEAARQARRLLQLQEDLIPVAASKVAAEEWLQKKEVEHRTMVELLDEIQKRDALDPAPEPEHSSNHYVLEFKRADDELRQAQQRRREAFGRVGDMLRRYREEGPRLTEERQRLEAAARKASRFAAAVRMAADLLREISRESYEEWATALNERANRTLVHLNPGYRDLRFDTDLSFTLEEVATGRRLDRDAVDTQLSAGARDQIYLAIRLAVSDYFSAGKVKLPLILDDALATADDNRFDRALTFLAERISPHHQVLLLSCHEARHERFRQQHPDLYDARILRLSLPSAPEPRTTTADPSASSDQQSRPNAATATPSSD